MISREIFLSLTGAEVIYLMILYPLGGYGVIYHEIFIFLGGLTRYLTRYYFL